MLGEPPGGLPAPLLFVGLLLAGAVVLVLAVSLLVAAFKLLLFMVMIPVRLVGWLLGLGVAAAALLIKGVLLAGIVGLLIVAGLLPLLAILLVGALVLYLIRAGRKRASHAGV